MIGFELAQFRPGKWAKVDRATGTVIGLATPEEVAAWQAAQGTPEEAPGRGW